MTDGGRNCGRKEVFPCSLKEGPCVFIVYWALPPGGADGAGAHLSELTPRAFSRQHLHLILEDFLWEKMGAALLGQPNPQRQESLTGSWERTLPSFSSVNLRSRLPLSPHSLPIGLLPISQPLLVPFVCPTPSSLLADSLGSLPLPAPRGTLLSPVAFSF